MTRVVRSRFGVLALVGTAILAGCGSAASPSPSPSPPASPAGGETPAPSAAIEPSAVPTASPAASTTVYTVRKGDTLIAIAKRFHITLAALREANPQVTDPTKLQIGAKLVIPAP